MFKISLTDKIIEVLEKENRLTIKEIFERSELGKDLEVKIEKEEDKKELLKLEKQLFLKRESIRNAIIRLSSINKRKKLIKDGMRGKQYLYSLRDKATTDKALLRKLYDTMGEDMEIKEDKVESFLEKEDLFEQIEERI